MAESDVPERARKSFAASQPGAAASWRPGPGPTYEALFSRGGKKQAYVYDVNGSLQLKKLSISVASLPERLEAKVTGRRTDSKVEAVYKVISRTKQRYYEVQFTSQVERRYERYSVAGNPLGHSYLALTPSASPDPVQASSTPSYASETAPAATKPAPTIAMRGESATTVTTDIDLSKDINLEDEMMDDDIKDLLNDTEDFDIDAMGNDDMGEFEDIDIMDLDEDDDWEDIDPF